MQIRQHFSKYTKGEIYFMSKDNLVHNKKDAYSFAQKEFGIVAEDIFEESGNLRALFRMNVPLYAPGLPKLLSVPLELIFRLDSKYSYFTVLLPKPFYVNIDQRNLEKIVQFTATFLSQVKRIQFAQAEQRSTTDVTPEIGVIYFYYDNRSVQKLLNSKDLRSTIFSEIQQDLLIFFSMLCNHLGVSVKHMAEHAGIGCSELVLDERA